MTTLNLYELKNTFKDSLKPYVYPQQTSYASSISLFDSNSLVTQSFNFFSTAYTIHGVYISEIVGSPSPLIVDVLSGASTLSSSTLSSVTIGWNLIDYTVNDINSSRNATLNVYSTSLDVGNDYFIGKDSASTYFYGSSTMNIAFTFGVKDFIYPVFPATEIVYSRVPVAVVDIIARPSTKDKYLDGYYIWYDINLQVDVYGKVPSEVDKIVSGIDRGITKNRRDFAGIRNIIPRNITPLEYMSANMFIRSVVYTAQLLVAST